MSNSIKAGMDNKAVGQRIREIRGALSRDSFAEQVGIHRNTLINYEKGDRPPETTVLYKICEEFKISPEWLLMGTDNGKPASCLDAKTSHLHALLDIILDSGRDGAIQAIKGDLEVLSRATEQAEKLERLEAEMNRVSPVLEARADEKKGFSEVITYRDFPEIRYSTLTEDEKRYLNTGKGTGAWILNALKMREHGSTYIAIGKKVGRIPVQVRICIGKAYMRIADYRKGIMLSIRTENALRNVGFLDKDLREFSRQELEILKKEIREKLQTNEVDIKRMGNFGRKSYEELCRWVGLFSEDNEKETTILHPANPT